MKFAKIFVAFVAIMVLSAGFVFAADDVSVNVSNDNANSATATGGNATQNQNQGQIQNQDQTQRQKQQQNVEGVSGNQSVTVPRNHIVAPLLNAFVGAPTAMAEGWKPFVCQPLFSVYTKDRLNVVSGSGSFFDRKGGFFHKLTTNPIRSVIHKPLKGEVDDKSVTLINWEPVGNAVYASDELLGEFECEGDYGWPMGAALGRCLAEAKNTTNTTRVFAYVRARKDPKNSGFSLGSGAAGAALFGSPDTVAGAIGLGGLIGTTTAYVDMAYDWTVLALNDGPTVPPPGVYVCGEEPPSVRIIIERRPEPVRVEPPKAVEPEKPAVCNPEPIRREIERLKVEISKCKFWGLNNLRLRFLLANEYAKLAKCTGENGYYSDAVKNYDLAEKNYLNGKDIKKNQAEADQILYKVYWNWAAVLREVYGWDTEVRFAQSKKMTTMPSGINELKR